MKKTMAVLFSLSLVFLSLAGCTANKTAPSPSPTGNPATSAAGDTVKTGLAVLSSIAKSTEAAADKEGVAEVDSNVVAVTVDNSGKIIKCIIDSVQTKIAFSATGEIKTDLATEIQTKQELGEKYGMKKGSGIGKEWSEEASAFAKYAEGKTVNEIKGIALNDKGAPADKELSSSVTISVGDYIAAIEKAVTGAKSLGAKSGDKLGLGVVTGIPKSVNAGEKDGVAQAYSNYAVSTFDASGKITSCVIDASQTDRSLKY